MADTMIKSMTGFGRCEQSEGTRTITIEMKSVNHRYLEAGIKMPKKLNIFEAGWTEAEVSSGRFRCSDSGSNNLLPQ